MEMALLAATLGAVVITVTLLQARALDARRPVRVRADLRRWPQRR